MKRGRNREGYSDPTACIAIGRAMRAERRQCMFEKYIENFNADASLKAFMHRNQLTRHDAIHTLRQKIPGESYYQKHIQTALKRRYPDAFVVKIAQGAYSQAGIPDVLCILDGHYFGFEVKRPILGTATDLQKKRIREIEQAGGTAAVVIWPEECFRIIDTWRKEREA
jgi:hypothetical protein